ncbi:MAG TPA: hypothetical protein VHR38_00900, partial [Solirubrobacterales bacterium]|nr:hypothetical protein [Solirubrobacterales bacterium]
MGESNEGTGSATRDGDGVLRSPRLRIFVLSALALALIAASSPSRAHGEYTVSQCVPNSVPYTDAGAYAFGAYSIWA